MARRPSSAAQFAGIVAIAAGVYLLLRTRVGVVAGYVAVGFAGVLVGLYLPLWADRAGRRTRTRVRRWGWWR